MTDAEVKVLIKNLEKVTLEERNQQEVAGYCKTPVSSLHLSETLKLLKAI